MTQQLVDPDNERVYCPRCGGGGLVEFRPNNSVDPQVTEDYVCPGCRGRGLITAAEASAVSNLMEAGWCDPSGD